MNCIYTFCFWKLFERCCDFFRNFQSVLHFRICIFFSSNKFSLIVFLTIIVISFIRKLFGNFRFMWALKVQECCCWGNVPGKASTVPNFQCSNFWGKNATIKWLVLRNICNKVSCPKSKLQNLLWISSETGKAITLNEKLIT